MTTVDPALEAWDAQPTHVRGNSPSQSIAGSALAAAALGGPIGALAVGGLVAVAASELLAARHDGPTTPAELADVGRPSEAALRAAASLEAMDRARHGAPGSVVPEVPGPVVDGSAANSDNSTRD